MHTLTGLRDPVGQPIQTGTAAADGASGDDVAEHAVHPSAHLCDGCRRHHEGTDQLGDQAEPVRRLPSGPELLHEPARGSVPRPRCRRARQKVIDLVMAELAGTGR